jgi:virulence-associated protein VapD
MYAILIQLDSESLLRHFNDQEPVRAYRFIDEFIINKGFSKTQELLYFGNDQITSVDCVLVIQELSRKFDWFKACAKTIRMLRIEGNEDLIVALG